MTDPAPLVVVAVLLLLGLAAGARLVAQKPDAKLIEQGLSGNPVLEGWYADPEAIVYGRTYWIFPTWSDDYPEARAVDDTPLTARQKSSPRPTWSRSRG